ncbi:protein decapping 5 [Diospyros lotus]|uniref:protein decapping 5 n=1 Tax=Diospyros lotus TaxID=55363 RepID=UPI00225315F3|nr:protein decapping 5 [Diospyros lotus]
MSRREDGRESESKRHRSRFDREPSPKRSRRDGKPATERPPSNLSFDVRDQSDREQKHRRRLQDALPLEGPEADSKLEAGAGRKEFDKKTNALRDGTKSSSNPTEVPRSRSYFQHDERGNAGQAGRTAGRGAATERGWWRETKDQHGERAKEKTATRDVAPKIEKSQGRGDENRVWRHDGFYEIEADRQPPVRKRPSFREKKVTDSENVDKTGADPVKPSRPDRPFLGSERREDRGSHYPRYSDGPEKPSVGDREVKRGDVWRGSFQSRDRYGGGNNYRGRDRFSGRGGGGGGYRPSTVRVVEKWKHDLFEEANRSPSPKNEEDQIVKVEALLAS